MTRLSSNRWFALLLLFLARFAMAFQFQSLAAVSPVLMADLALEFALLGTLIGIWMAPGLVFAIPGGALGERFGAKRMVVLGLALMALGTLVIATAAEYNAVLAGRLVSGVGAVLVNVLLTKMAADWFADREVSTAMAVLVVSWPLGIGVALAVLGPLAGASSWGVAMQLTAFVCIIACIMVAFAYRAPSVASSPARSASRLLRRELVLVSAAGIVWANYNVAYIVVVSFVPVLLTERGTAVADATLLASLAAWPLALTAPIGGIIADRTGRPMALIYSCFAAMAVCMVLMLTSGHIWLALLLFGIVTGPCAGPIMALPAKALAPQTRALGMGVFFTWYYLAMALFPPLAGLVRDLSGYFASPLVVGGGLLALAAVALYGFSRGIELRVTSQPSPLKS